MAAEEGIYSTGSAEAGGLSEKVAAAEPAVNVTPQLSSEGEIIVPDYDAPVAAVRSAGSSTGGDGKTYTIDEAIEKVGFGRYQILVLLMAGLCWTADAMEMLLLSYIKQPLQCEWGIKDYQAAAITTAVGVGMLFGSVTWGIVADTYGRRFGFLAVAAFTFVFGVLSALSPSYGAIVILRGLVGFGIGGVPVAFSLMMEFLPVAQRGTWGMGVVLFWSGGAMFESLVAMYVMPTLGWRWLVGISSLPLGVLLLLWPVLPESPRWLVGQGKLEEAVLVLEQAARINGTELPAGKLSAVFEAADDGHGSVNLDGLKELLHPVTKPLTFRLWYLWFSCAFVYYGLVMVQPDLISLENKGERCDYAVPVQACVSGSEEPRCTCPLSAEFDMCIANTDCEWAPQQAVAMISGEVTGTITFTRASPDASGVKIEVVVSHADGPDEPTDGHKWHIHENPVESGDPVDAGGHYDPTHLETDENGQKIDGYACRALPNGLGMERCYAGDLSGKFLSLRIGPPGQRIACRNRDLTGAEQVCSYDDRMLTLDEIVGRSIVIHDQAGAANRIACGTIRKVGIPVYSGPPPTYEVDGGPSGTADWTDAKGPCIARVLDGACAAGLTADDYIDSFISTSGEFPGIILTVVLIDILGRRPMLGYMFGICALAFVVILPCIGRAAETAVFFVARGASNGFFQGVYLFTNELYPADIRATGMGMSSAIARVGLICTPFVAQTLDAWSLPAAMGIYCLSACIAIWCLWTIPVETTGRPMLGTMAELVAMFEGPGTVGQSLKNDDAASPLVQKLRWSAKYDGQTPKRAQELLVQAANAKTAAAGVV
jgi:MFS family permease/Cu/Zn superoxide dismutase